MCRNYDHMMTGMPKMESLPAYWFAMACLRAHGRWRRYFELRPLLAFPVERAARTAFDLVSHFVRYWSDPLYAQVHGTSVLWSDVPQREPGAWWEVGHLLLDLKLVLAVYVAVTAARRGLNWFVRRQEESQEGRPVGLEARGAWGDSREGGHGQAQPGMGALAARDTVTGRTAVAGSVAGVAVREPLPGGEQEVLAEPDVERESDPSTGTDGAAIEDVG
jgi:hypothetical protein